MGAVQASLSQGLLMQTPKPSASDDAILGRAIGHYRIQGFVARGGMGTVYRAEHHLIGKAAAVKVLRPELSRQPEVVQRFFNEARAASAIRHPGIIEVYDFGHLPDGRAYIVMELLQGETLSTRLERCGRLPELSAAMIGRGISVALAAAHGLGIVHRDLKPDNIFLVPDPELPTGERCKVLDFGIAKLATSDLSSVRNTRTGTCIGTPLYMSPEQARGLADLDHRSDLYSLGCMLYEMVTGEPPFMADGAAEILAMHLYGEFVPLVERVPEISPAFAAVIESLICKRPDDRIQSAAELVDALSQALPQLSERLSNMIAVPGGVITLDQPIVIPTPRRARGSAPPPMRTTLGSSAGTPQVSLRPSRMPALVFGSALLAAAAAVGLIAARPVGMDEMVPVAPLVVEATTAPVVQSLTPPPAPSSVEVVVTLSIDPADAVVTVDGGALVAEDGELHLLRGDREHRLDVTAPGYLPRSLTVRADRDQVVALTLAPIPKPIAAPAAPPVRRERAAALPRPREPEPDIDGTIEVDIDEEPAAPAPPPPPRTSTGSPIEEEI
jgi:serine/threonine protein kinase